MSARALSDLERGRRRPRRSTATALAAALKLTDPEADGFLLTRRPGQPPVGRPIAPGCQLPAAPADFTGRSAELDLLVSAGSGEATEVSVVVGKPGAGKTALAVRAAHQLVDRYPDGQLYLDLRGTSATPTQPFDALGQLLRALGLVDQEVPTDLDGRIGRYRSLIHDRAVLIVLDNAADERQVRPLLPAGARCRALVTGRQALLGLDTSQRITLGELTAAEAVRLLIGIVGAQRVAAEQLPARALARLCGHLPLALRIAGNRLASRPDWTIASLVAVMRDQRTRLSQLSVGDLAVRPAFAVSHAQLPALTRTVFAMLSLVPAPDFGVGSAASLAVADLPEAAGLLEELADAHLIEPADRSGRYRFHDLLWLFANERRAADHTPDQVHTAQCRWVDWLVTHAVAAGAWLDPSGDLTPASAQIADRAHALAWLADEHDTILAFVRRAEGLDADAELLDLAAGLAWYFDLCGRWEDWRELNEHALAAAHRLGDYRHAAIIMNQFGVALYCLRRMDAAIELHHMALKTSREVDDPIEEATALHSLGVDFEEVGRLPDAVDHHRQALAIADRIDKPWLQGRSLGKIADSLLLMGRFADAVDFSARARSVAAGLGDPRGEAYSLCRLGRAVHGLGRLPEAISHLSASAELFCRLCDQWSEGWARHSLGLAYQDSGLLTDARDQYRRALALFEQIGDRHWQDIVRRDAATRRRIPGPGRDC